MGDSFSIFEQFDRQGSWFWEKAFILPGLGLLLVLRLVQGGVLRDSGMGLRVWDWVVREQYRLLSLMLVGVGVGYGKWLFLLYLLIAVWNVVGLLPFSYALTGQLVVTFLLGLGMWIGKLKVGVSVRRWKLLGNFLPVGLPLALGPFFLLIELVGFVIPLVSISVRLFANIVSGHVLIHVLLGFIWGGAVSGLAWLWVTPGFLLLLLVGLEWGVAFIQAYVFVLLISVYLGEVDDKGFIWVGRWEGV